MNEDRALGLALAGWMTLIASGVAAEEFHFEQAGVRSGFSATSIQDQFYQTEVFLRVATPWRLDLGSDWRIRSSADASAGRLARGGDQGFVGAVGPVLSFGRENFPVELVTGCSATLLSRDEFDRVNLGVPFQFTSHLGVNVQFAGHFAAGYRLQHMSNASISRHNPGLDMHFFSLGYWF